MGILEIILTIFAWRNGWKWLSLIPIGTVFVLAFLLGVSGHSDSNIFWLDIMAIVALIVMLINKKKSEEETKKTD